MSVRPTTWTMVTAHLPAEPEEWSNWIQVFERHGVSGTLQTDDPPTLSAYLAPEDEPGPLCKSLKDFGAAEVTVSQIEEQDWSESWKKFFRPTRIGQKLVVRPSWEDYKIQAGDIEIVLDPGQAFGTGDHPTTKMCLALIENALTRATDRPLRLADIGCGSGILSIAAKKLVHCDVVAVDIDKPSIAAAKENAVRNNVSIKCLLGKGFEPLGPHEKFDIVVSNIISSALILLAPEASERVAPGGLWIVSGVIEANWPDVLNRAESVGFSLETEKRENEWVAAAFRL